MEREYQNEVLEEAILSLKDIGDKAVEIRGIPTGVKGLDDLFFTTRVEKGKVEVVPLGGIPQYSVFNLTGISDTGKSLMGEQFAIKQASLGNSVAFVTVEAPAHFVATSMKSRAIAMGIDESVIDENIIFIDAASYLKLREDIPTLLATLAYAIKNYKIKFTIIDSITGLYEAKEMLARVIVRQIFNFMKKWYQTAIFVSQKRSSQEEFSAEAAGGFAISHIVDGTMVLSKVLINSQYMERIYKRPLGEVVRLFRIDGCRMCGHSTDTYLFEIDKNGLVRIGLSLKELSRGGGIDDNT
ncbi:MAG TPA: KaiC domain-containing protein [Dictyoglomaceae bacterium]|nr:KaiC domain-containing protein [Dictyoglomaceae bacterium]HOL39050.1 KaiC domain-containing protein [Dictyoglomaceae bacterium]HOP94389.1 KaiC domain-containing protein [Dictyoglomaceae bacterium]HPP15774.1 KaiC domain-containing protein [Dictyoglomaceae bacterium]HPU42763.1 KaiC domain-containing protein [Dictyoglomaceae bacterium]